MPITHHFSGVSLTGEAEARFFAHEKYLDVFGGCPTGLVDPSGQLYSYTQGTFPANHPAWPNSGYHTVEIEPDLYSPSKVDLDKRSIVGIGCTTGEAYENFIEARREKEFGLTDCPVCFNVSQDLDSFCLYPPGKIDEYHINQPFVNEWNTNTKYELTFDWSIERRKFRVDGSCTNWPDCATSGNHNPTNGQMPECDFEITEGWTEQDNGSEAIAMLPYLTQDSTRRPVFSGDVASWNQNIVAEKAHATLTLVPSFQYSCSGTASNEYGMSFGSHYWHLDIETDYIPLITSMIPSNEITMNPTMNGAYPFFIYNSGTLGNDSQLRYGIAKDIYKDIYAFNSCVGPEDTEWKGISGVFPDSYCLGDPNLQGRQVAGLQYCNHGCFFQDTSAENPPTMYNTGHQWRVKIDNPVVEKTAGFEFEDNWRYQVSGNLSPTGLCDIYRYYHFYKCNTTVSLMSGNLNECQIIEALEPQPESGMRVKIPRAIAPWAPEDGPDGSCGYVSDPDPNDNCTITNFGSGINYGYAQMDYGLDCGVLIERADDGGEWDTVSSLDWMGCWDGAEFTLVSGCLDCPASIPPVATTPWPPLGSPVIGQCASYNSGNMV